MPIPTLDADRAAFLESRQKLTPVTVPAWPRAKKDLPQVQVDVDWIRFSTLNHRTRVEQLSAIHKAGRDDLFTSDPLGPTAQTAQYEILKKQAGFDGLREDLRSRRQQEPAIITADGVLINGNRRAAALRSLYQSSDLNAKYIRCLVLPNDATTEELVDLEAELQVAKDFKQEYSWINEALLIEELYDRENKDWDHVAARMHRKVSDIRELYDKLQQVHQLVAMSQGARLHEDFTDNESAFDELAKHIRNKAPAEAEAVKAVYFLGTLAGAEYRNLRHLRRPDAAELVLAELKDNATFAPILEIADREKAHESPQDDPLDDLLGKPEPSSSLSNLLGLVAKERKESSLILPDGVKVSVPDVLDSLKGSITAAAKEAEEEQRDHSAVLAPTVRAKKAVAELQRALGALLKARVYEDWDEADFQSELAAIDSLMGQIRAAT